MSLKPNKKEKTVTLKPKEKEETSRFKRYLKKLANSVLKPKKEEKKIL